MGVRKAVFLDRDGVINACNVHNGKPFAPKSFEEFRLYQGTETQLTRLKKSGFYLVVITNQPDVGNKITSLEQVEKMHDYLISQTDIDSVFACYHSQNAGCLCRKPRLGLFYTAAEEGNISPQYSFMVGDRNSDIVAGNQFGCRSIFIDRSYTEKLTAEPWCVVRDLRGAVDKILEMKVN